MARKIIVVTAAYGNDRVKALGGQSAVLPFIAGSGADGVEIRRELFSADELNHLPELAADIERRGLLVCYSAPEALFTADGSLNPRLADFLQEAQTLNALWLKLSLGRFTHQNDLDTLRDILRESGMAHAILQARRKGVPVLGICGGYQMLGETIIDEVESGLGTQPGLGLLNTVTHFAHSKTTTQVTATLAPALPAWLAATAGLAVSGYEIHMGETELRDGCRSLMQLHKGGLSVADGAVSDDGLAFGTYLHGLFDSDAFTRALVNGLRQRKGLAALDSDFEYAQYKSRQFDLLADAMRQHIDIEKIYAIMRQHQEPVC